MASLGERISSIEGIFGQINERLGNLERGQGELRQELRAEMQSNFRWLMGTMLVMWVTIIGVVVGALLAG